MRQRHLGPSATPTTPATDGSTRSLTAWTGTAVSGPLTTSVIGLGCMGLSQGYGPALNDRDAIGLIHRALDLGVTLFDTAISYGAGHNERLVGRALAGRREPVTVATKFGIVRDADGVHLDARPEHVRGYCEASLQRLDVEAIDLYYLHRVDPRVPIGETIAAMAELVDAGKVRHLGLSEVTADQLEQAAAVHPITAVQLEWSLAWREPETDLVPAARRLGVGLVAYSPLGRGLLTGAVDATNADVSEFRRRDDRFHGNALSTNLCHVAALRGIAAELGITPGQLALAWLLAQGSDVIAIPGTRNPHRLDQNAAAADVELTDLDLSRIREAFAEGWAGDRASFAVPVTTRSRA